MERLPSTARSRRLEFRRWEIGDAELLHDAVTRNVDHLRPWMPWVSDEPRTVAQRRELLAAWNREWESGGDATFGVFDGEAVVGSSGLHRRGAPTCLHVGYWVDGSRLRRGLATEIAETMTSLAFGVGGIETVEIHHDAANTASRGVAAKLGFDLVGSLPSAAEAPGESGVECTWRITREVWSARRR